MAILKNFLLGRIISGPFIQKLFEEVRVLTGVPFVFGFDSGASAITACLKGSGIGIDDEVIMPSFCCHSVAEAIESTGASPRFCEIQHDLNPDVGSILSLIRPSVKAIIFPHFFGRPGDILALDETLRKKGLRKDILLIDDAAQSFGAKINGRYLGTFGDAGIISFGPGKMTTATGGGLLLTHSEKLAKNVNELAVHPYSLVRKFQDLFYWIVFRRWRKYSIHTYRYLSFIFKRNKDLRRRLFCISNIDAAIALSQIKKLDCLIASRKIIKKQLDQILLEIRIEYNLNIEGLKPCDEDRRESFNKYIFFVDCRNKSSKYPNFMALELYHFLIESGIELQPLYALLHLSQHYGKEDIKLPFTEKRVDTVLHFCTDPTLSTKEIERIGRIIKRYFKKNIKLSN